MQFGSDAAEHVVGSVDDVVPTEIEHSPPESRQAIVAEGVALLGRGAHMCALPTDLYPQKKVRVREVDPSNKPTPIENPPLASFTRKSPSSCETNVLDLERAPRRRLMTSQLEDPPEGGRSLPSSQTKIL